MCPGWLLEPVGDDRPRRMVSTPPRATGTGNRTPLTGPFDPPPVRIALANHWCPPLGHAEVVAGDALRRELARGLAARGWDTHVVQEHPQRGTLVDGAVRWHFVPPSAPTRWGRRLLAPRPDAMVKAPADALPRALRALAPDLIQSFDLAFTPTLLLLGALGVPLVAHFHGGAPARNGVLAQVEAAAFRRVDRFLFTTRARAEAWSRIPPERVVEVFESSSVFTPGDRAQARRQTGIDGDPACLHLGRLDGVKDPLTTLAGFRRLHARRPDARLHLAWTDAPLEDAVRTAAEGLPVHFLGRRSDVETLLRASDLLIQGSLREVCGMAAMEALAVGVTPVVTDIPPFRRLTAEGRFGRLFPVGDADALADAAALGPLPRADVRGWFDRALSFDRLTDAVDAVYRDVLGRGP